MDIQFNGSVLTIDGESRALISDQMQLQCYVLSIFVDRRQIQIDDLADELYGPRECLFKRRQKVVAVIKRLRRKLDKMFTLPDGYEWLSMDRSTRTYSLISFQSDSINQTCGSLA